MLQLAFSKKNTTGHNKVYQTWGLRVCVRACMHACVCVFWKQVSVSEATLRHPGTLKTHFFYIKARAPEKEGGAVSTNPNMPLRCRPSKGVAAKVSRISQPGQTEHLLPNKASRTSGTNDQESTKQMNSDLTYLAALAAPFFLLMLISDFSHSASSH